MNDSVILERSYILVNESMKTVALQCRRLRTKEPEDGEFIFRYGADLQFLILSLYKLRKSVRIAKKIPSIATEVQTALDRFNRDVPDLKKFRDVEEHMDEYTIDLGQNKSVDRKQIHSSSWDGTVYKWIGGQLNVTNAEIAAQELYKTFQTIKKNFLQTQNS